jgi:hypothetical protein
MVEIRSYKILIEKPDLRQGIGKLNWRATLRLNLKKRGCENLDWIPMSGWGLVVSSF